MASSLHGMRFSGFLKRHFAQSILVSVSRFAETIVKGLKSLLCKKHSCRFLNQSLAFLGKPLANLCSFLVASLVITRNSVDP